LKQSLASFDILALTGTVGGTLDGLTQGELQSLDYLACLMAVYDGHPPQWWGFGYSVTETGAPFAREPSAAVGGLVAARWLLRDGRVHRLSTAGRTEFDFESTLGPNQRRLRYLRAASSAALSMPLPSISDALSHEPGLRRALSYLRRKQLLDETSLALLSEQFAALTDGLGRAPQDREDLMIPVVVWLTYLTQTGDPQRDAA
jgi:hypothetical protein